MTEKANHRSGAIPTLARTVCTLERATAGATELVKLFFLTGSLRIITWGVVRGQEQMKAHIEPKSKECPFCGASTYEVMSGTGVKCIRCTNKSTCGAIVSFNNKDCDERGVSPVKYFNRRTERKVLQSACGKGAKNESDS